VSDKGAEMISTTSALRVLYLEDNPVDADLTRRELARLAPDIVLDVATTLSAARERLAPAVPPFDVVLADLRLPDGSGLELLAHIRERELPLAVVIITGSGDQEAAVAALKAGADDYLVKKTENISNLPHLLSAAYTRFQMRRERRATPLRLLYAEPNAFDIDLTRRYLARHAPHIRMEVVGSGEEILALLPLSSAEPAAPVDVLLLDYHIPGLNALEVIKILLQERRLDISIVLVTGHGTEEIAVQALRLGVADYLVKHEGYLHRLPGVLEQAQKQAALNKSLAQFRNLSQEFQGLLDAIPDSLMLIDRDMKVLWANSTASEHLGIAVNGLGGQYCYNLCCDRTTPCEACPVLHCLESGAPWSETVTRPDGRIWDIRAVPLMDEQGKVTKVIEVKRDITEHKKLETQYIHAQKMESIGTLAGGIAHDFNNILTVIISLGQIMLMKMREDDPQRQNISDILEATSRATSLTRELLLFSRKQVSERKPVDLNDILVKTGTFLHRTIGADIALKIVPYASSLLILADRHQLQQVLMNLAVNARDAMPEGGGLVLKTEQVGLDEGFTTAYGFGKPGAHALLTVSDTGTGMDRETLQRIFEPFFSTKEVGKGTGLGLAVVYGIIKQHDGFITACSEPGQGATFKIYLPLSEAAGQVSVAVQEQPVAGGTETILLAEDDDMVRSLMTLVLTEAGYTVIAAVDGEDAVRKFQENPTSIELLFFDLIMPRMNGKEACDAISKMQPGIKTIFSSGYALDTISQKASLADGVMHLIQKPVTPHDILEKVRSVLDDAPS
jgi:signal transduction histidine kinase/DNA-binding NtrC family response regulator